MEMLTYTYEYSNSVKYVLYVQFPVLYKLQVNVD